jgi:hypothetical protein
MPGVVSGIVDKHVDCIESLKNFFNRRFDCRDVARVTVEVDGRSGAGCFNFLDESVRGRILDIQKCDALMLHYESFDNGLADTARTTCHDNDAIAKTWVGSHIFIQVSAPPGLVVPINGLLWSS